MTISQREWLSQQIDETTGLPLAKMGSRGRFSKAAIAALAKAYSEGMEFLEDAEPEEKPQRAKRVTSEGGTATISRVKAPEREYDFNDVRAWCARQGIEVGARGRIKGEILAQYDASNPVVKAKIAATKPERPRVRPENVAYGLTAPVEGHPYMQRVSVAFEKCGHCKNRIGWCSCDGGPRCPSYVNGGEVASLSKP